MISRALLFVGGIAAALAWWGFAAQQTLLDPSATRDAAAGLLSAQPVQSSAVDSLAQQLSSLVPNKIGGTAVTDAQTRTLAQDAATVALRDPALRKAFADAVASLQQQLIDGTASKRGLTVDTSAVNAAVRHAVERVDPELAAKLPANAIRLHFDTSRLPNLRGVDKHTGTLTLLAALVAMMAWGGAVLVHPEPWKAVRTIGRRVVMIGVLPLVFWVLIPAGLRAIHVAAAEVVTPLASAYGQRLAPPAFAVLGVGIVLWLLGRFNGFSALTRGAAPGVQPTASGRSSGRSTGPNPIAYGRRGAPPLDTVDMKI